ncbi:MAG: arginase [Prevotellaceae bacterium]|jgi:arginase|nr:arginase [Prevotellaceae bacterium]
MRTLSLIGAPIHIGCDKRGTELAPDRLRKCGIVELLQRHVDVVDAGNIIEPDVCEKDKFSEHPRIKYLKEIQDISRQLSHKMYNALCGETFPLVIGGDHVMGLGDVAGMARYFGEQAGVIWFDAHGDFNTEQSSPSGNTHGMPCAALMGTCHNHLSSLAEVKVKPENIFWVGIRDLDPYEEAFAREHNLSIYRAETIRKNGMAFVIDDILRQTTLRNINNIHFSIDVDGIDPSEAPGTGTAVPDGISTADFRQLLHGMFASGKIRSAELAEYNPLLDTDNITERWCVETIDYIASLL